MRLAVFGCGAKRIDETKKVMARYADHKQQNFNLFLTGDRFARLRCITYSSIDRVAKKCEGSWALIRMLGIELPRRRRLIFMHGVVERWNLLLLAARVRLIASTELVLT